MAGNLGKALSGLSKPGHSKTQKVDLGHKGSFTVHKGRLHRALGISEDSKIPASRISSAMNSSRKFEGQSVAEMARSAKGLKAMKH